MPLARGDLSLGSKGFSLIGSLVNLISSVLFGWLFAPLSFGLCGWRRMTRPSTTRVGSLTKSSTTFGWAWLIMGGLTGSVLRLKGKGGLISVEVCLVSLGSVGVRMGWWSRWLLLIITWVPRFSGSWLGLSEGLFFRFIRFLSPPPTLASGLGLLWRMPCLFVALPPCLLCAALILPSGLESVPNWSVFTWPLHAVLGWGSL
jgi:hypothetical protein